MNVPKFSHKLAGPKQSFEWYNQFHQFSLFFLSEFPLPRWSVAVSGEIASSFFLLFSPPQEYSTFSLFFMPMPECLKTSAKNRITGVNFSAWRESPHGEAEERDEAGNKLLSRWSLQFTLVWVTQFSPIPVLQICGRYIYSGKTEISHYDECVLKHTVGCVNLSSSQTFLSVIANW